MPKIDWKQLVGTVAPTLATALGGPLAGIAVKTIAGKLLGKADATEEEVAQAIVAGDPAMLVQLKQAEYEFKKTLLDSEVRLEEVAANDRASARMREIDSKDSWTPRVLAAVVIFGFLYCVISVMTGRVPNMNDPVIAGLVGTLVGYASAKADQVISYYFGSSASSKDKDRTISDIAKME